MIDISIHEKVAVLIDADNAQLNDIEQILEISEYYGQLAICRAYGDWKRPPLSSWCEKLDALKIDCRQIDRVGKNATDHGLLLEAGEILSFGIYQDSVQVFVIVSGDGDFASAAKLIEEKGTRVVCIGNKKHTSGSLRQACEEFYFLEDLQHELSELKKLHPISPREVRVFFNFLFFAYHQLTPQKRNWVPCAQLGEKLRELAPDYESKFGKYKLSEWLRSVDKEFEASQQKVRRIDTNPEATRFSLIIKAYIQTKGEDGLAHLGQLGQALHVLDPDYETRFGSKKLSEWLEAYPDIFKLRENYAIHQRYWQMHRLI